MKSGRKYASHKALVNKLKANRLEIVYLALIAVQFFFIIYINLFQNQKHIGFDASPAFLKSIEIWKQKTIFPVFYEQSQLMLDSSPALFASVLYGLTGNVFISFGIINIITSFLFIFLFRLLLKEFVGDNKMAVLIPISILFSPFLNLYYSNINPINDVYNILFVSGAYYAFRNLTGLFCVKLFSDFYKESCPKIPLLILSALLLFICGVSSGLYMIVTFLAPLFIVFIVRSLVKDSFDNKRPALFVVILMIICFGGKIFSKYILHYSPLDSKELIHSDIFFKNIGGIYCGFIELLGGMMQSIPTNLMSVNGILILTHFVFANGILITTLVVMVRQCKKDKLNLKLLPYMVIIIFNLFVFSICNLSYGFSSYEHRYLVVIYLCMLIVVGFFIAECELLKNRQLRNIAFTSLWIILTFSNVVSLDKYNNTTIAYSAEQCATILKNYETGLVYCDDGIIARNLRVLDRSRIYKQVELTETGNPVLYHWGDYKYLEDSLEYIGQTVLLTTDENFNKYPDYIRSKYVFQQFIQEMGLNLYLSKDNPFDFLNGLPRDDYISSINYPYTSGVCYVNAEILENGALYSDGTSGTVLWGPYAASKKGNWDFTLNYEILQGNSSGEVGLFYVTTDFGQNVINTVPIVAGQTSVTIQGIHFENPGIAFEHKVDIIEGVKIKIISVVMTKAA